MIDSFVANGFETLASAMDAGELPGGLFGQTVILNIGGGHWISNKELDMEFHIPFGGGAGRAEAEIVIYNLSHDTINHITNFCGLQDHWIACEAGYGEDFGTIFVGRIKEMKTTEVGADRETVIHALGEGVAAVDVSLTYAEGTLASAILRDLVLRGNMPVAEYSVLYDRPMTQSVTIDGDLAAEIDKYAAMCGVSAWFVNGAMYVRDLRKKPTILVPVNRGTGLIESPAEFMEEGEDPRFEEPEQKLITRGWSFKTLLNHRLAPGVGVDLDSLNAQGRFMVREGKHSFDGLRMISEVTCVE